MGVAPVPLRWNSLQDAHCPRAVDKRTYFTRSSSTGSVKAENAATDGASNLIWAKSCCEAKPRPPVGSAHKLLRPPSPPTLYFCRQPTSHRAPPRDVIAVIPRWPWFSLNSGAICCPRPPREDSRQLPCGKTADFFPHSTCHCHGTDAATG